MYFFLGLHKGRPSHKRTLQLSKRNIQHFKTWNFLIFFYFCGSFMPGLLDPDPDPEYWIRILGPDWIRIQYGSGSGSTTQICRSARCTWRTFRRTQPTRAWRPSTWSSAPSPTSPFPSSETPAASRQGWKKPGFKKKRPVVFFWFFLYILAQKWVFRVFSVSRIQF